MEFDIATEWQGRQSPMGSMAVVEAKNFRSEAKRESVDFNAAPAADQKMSKLVKENYYRSRTPNRFSRNFRQEFTILSDPDSGSAGAGPSAAAKVLQETANFLQAAALRRLRTRSWFALTP
jgi:hypothetical protein